MYNGSSSEVALCSAPYGFTSTSIPIWADTIIFTMSNATPSTRPQAFSALREIAGTLSAAWDLDTTLDLIARKTTEVMHVDSCSIYLLDPGGAFLRLPLAAEFPVTRAADDHQERRIVVDGAPRLRRDLFAQSGLIGLRDRSGG